VNRSYRIETLTEELMQQRVQDILVLEALFYRQFGLDYSHEVWTEKHFLYSLPGKWELSKVAIDEAANLVGFAIASHDGKEELRGHRGGVHPDWRPFGVWRALLDAIWTHGQRLGLKDVYFTVRVDNRQARLAYVFQGYRGLSNTELEEFRKRRGRYNDRIEGNRLISPEGYAYYAMHKKIEPL
jgi:ribosomal protein S18 acetylase RimI-like enzyme